jgi:AcrR family transcriptional regulator
MTTGRGRIDAMATTKTRTRRRRSAEEARAMILDAAERRLRESGPDALRLQDVAADVGISHPAILHHFGSREGLVHAVVKRAMDALEADLVQAFTTKEAGPPDGSMMLDRVFEMLAERGHGRLLAWLSLSGFERAFDTPSARASWRAIIDGTHALRLAEGSTSDREDTAFAVVLSAIAILGQAVAGPMVFRLAGVDDRGVERRFMKWFSALLGAHLSDERPSRS